MIIRTFPFTKMHGLGNDFVILDEVTGSDRDLRGVLPKKLPAELSRKISDRRFGVGCDQILRLVAPHDATKAQVRMEILNPDASEAEMCGNGIRAAALYLSRYDQKYSSPGSELRIETLAGLQVVKIEGDRGDGQQIRVDMGKAQVTPTLEKINISVDSEKISFEFREVSMGNPHAVILVSDVSSVPLEVWGPLLENHPRFPKRTNVEFVQVLSRSKIALRVWERGAGATLACGTGACAAMVAAKASGVIESLAQVHLPGGVLKIEWSSPTSSVIMTGPAEEVYLGQFTV